MMHILTNRTEFRPPFRRRHLSGSSSMAHAYYLSILTCCLFLSLWRPNPVAALYLQQQQQQQPLIISSNINNNNQQQQQQLAAGIQVPDNGQIMQALSQFAAQQVANGGLNGGLQVTATSTPTGAINIASNNQQVALVNGNNATGAIAVSAGGPGSAIAGAAPPTGPQQQQPQQASNQYVIKLLHNDPKNLMSYVSITPVNYTNLHEPRIELRYQSEFPWVSLADGSPNNTVVAAVIVNDGDSGPNGETSLAIEQGNELNHFKLVRTTYTNTIQVNGAPLSRHLRPEYNLTIVARDHGSPPKASSSTLVIKLHASPMQSQPSSQLPYTHSQHPALFNANSLEPIPSGLKPPVTDLMYVGAMLVVMFSVVIILIIVGCALVQRPTQKGAKAHKGPPATRTTSATNSRIVPPSDQCSAYCLTSGYDLSNLNIN